MSGVQIPWLGYSLMGAAVLLLLIPGWSFGKRVFQIFSSVRRLRIILEPVQRYKDVSARFSLKAPSAESKTLWLNQVIIDDKQELSNRLYQHIERWLFDNIHKSEPFMEVIIQIINATVFSVVIRGIEGSFQIQGTKCNWDATISGGTRIQHGEVGNIRISQRLSKETVDMMVTLHNERDGFMINLSGCYLVVQPEEPNVENEVKKIPIKISEQVRLG